MVFKVYTKILARNWTHLFTLPIYGSLLRVTGLRITSGDQQKPVAIEKKNDDADFNNRKKPGEMDIKWKENIQRNHQKTAWMLSCTSEFGDYPSMYLTVLINYLVLMKIWGTHVWF